MGDLRVWQLDLGRPLALQIAADARLTALDFTDDHTWEVAPGRGESAALALQTRYGGRAGLVSLVPMWLVDGRVIYQGAALAEPVKIRAFAPGFVQLYAKLTPQIGLLAEFWAMESHAVGGRFLLRNLTQTPQRTRLDLLGFVGIEGREQVLHVVPLPGERHALSLGKIGGLYPVVLLDNGYQPVEGHGNKVSADLALKPGGRAALRFVCAGRPDVRASLALAQRWLGQDWGAHFKLLSMAAQAIPQIETGSPDLDAAIAFSYVQLVQAFIKPAGQLPQPSFVGARQPDRGYSPRGDGSDHVRSWAGQDALTAYMVALAAAPVDPALAQGIVRNYLAIQRDDGWIDGRPGMAGQRAGYLCLPILARLTWSIFQYTEDTAFLREAFPRLLLFFERWRQADLDADGDGAPEWRGSGHLYRLDERLRSLAAETIETPALAAYLLSEALSLREIAYYLREAEIEARLADHVERLRALLAGFWRADERRYVYRDRDTHLSLPGETLLRSGDGDAIHPLDVALAQPARLIVEIEGGVDHTPKLTLTVEGSAPSGEPVRERVDQDAFVWQTGRGFYTTQAVFARIDRVGCEGLVRVYRLHVHTPDLSGHDITHLLPLWSAAIDPEQAAALIEDVRTTTEPAVTQPLSAEPLWVTLIGEGALEYGYVEDAAQLLRRLLDRQIETLKAERSFRASYSADRARALAEDGQSLGLIPHHLLLRALGVRIVSKTKVWTGGAFAWSAPVTVRQHGVLVRRKPKGTTIHFPSGSVIELAADAPWQEIIDEPTVAP